MAEEDDLSLDFTFPGALQERPAIAVVPETKAPEIIAPAPVSPQRPPALEVVAVDAPPLVASPPPPTDPIKAAAPPTALVEAATLYAEGKDIEAVRRLETALKSRERVGDDARRVWASLFDLLQILNRRPAFDSLAIAFAKHFESSPPTWNGGSVDSSNNPGDTQMTNRVALIGALNKEVATALKQAMTLAQTHSTIVIDLADLKSADSTGINLLMRLVSGLKKAKKAVRFEQPLHLAQLIKPLAVTGLCKDESIWLLLLELYQQGGQQELYDETAINYAVTFEISPPAWVPPNPAAQQVGPSAVESVKQETGFSLAGSIADLPQASLSQLNLLLSNPDPLMIDARNLRRISAKGASQLLQALTQGAAKPGKISIDGLAPLVAAYLESLGFAEVVELQSRSV